MGNLLDCCKGSSYEDITPDRETIRQQQAEAAERRLAEQERRGIGNIDVVKRQQRLAAEKAKQEVESTGAYSNEPPLKWQVS